MKISAGTMKVAREAAKHEGMSLDEWADKVLASAATNKQPGTLEALLREISEKVDQIADRQSLAEKANEQLGAMMGEFGSSFRMASKTTGRVFEQVRKRTGTAVGEIAGKALEAIGQVGKSASDLAVTISHGHADDGAVGTRGSATKKPKARTKPLKNRGGKAKSSSRRKLAPVR